MFQSIVLLLGVTSLHAFAPVQTQHHSRVLFSTVDPISATMDEIRSSYKAGGANTEFAKRFGHLAKTPVKTVGEAFADFTQAFGNPVNPLYKNMITDIVGTTHLVLVNARFTQDAVWSLGLLTSLDLLLKNYPEANVSDRIVQCLFQSLGIDEAKTRAEAKALTEWATTASKADVEAALSGEGSSTLATIANSIKNDEYWLYSRYFGIGLLKIMETVGVEMDKDEVYPVMEDWMSNKLGRSHLTACSDSDLFFKVREKLDMMETMMKEIEIREKKRMAERLEQKAEEALRAADKEAAMEAEIKAEAEKSRESVASS